MRKLSDSAYCKITTCKSRWTHSIVTIDEKKAMAFEGAIKQEVDKLSFFYLLQDHSKSVRSYFDVFLRMFF